MTDRTTDTARSRAAMAMPFLRRVGAVIMGPMSAGEMMRVASSAYGDLNL